MMTTNPRLTAKPLRHDADPKVRLSLGELDRVSITIEVRGDEGEIVPAGSTGTVVAVWSDGEAFDVEFTKPVEALATVDATAIGAVEKRNR